MIASTQLILRRAIRPGGAGANVRRTLAETRFGVATIRSAAPPAALIGRHASYRRGQQDANARYRTSPAAQARLIDVGGRRVALHVVPGRPPAVVFEAGGDVDGSAWDPVCSAPSTAMPAPS